MSIQTLNNNFANPSYWSIFKKNFKMKKISILSIFCLGLVFVSCKKDRECTCKETNTTISGSVSNTSTSETKTTIEKIKKGDAQEWCRAGEVETKQTANGGYTSTYKFDCELN